MTVFWNFLLSQGLITSAIVGFGYVFRASIMDFVAVKVAQKHDETMQTRDQKFAERFEDIQQNFQIAQSKQNQVLTKAFDLSSERAKRMSLKRQEAVEAVWESETKLSAFAMTAMTVDLLNMAGIKNASEPDKEKLAELAKVFGTRFTPEALDELRCTWTRLYISEKAWALYMAYYSIVTVAGVQLKSIELGLDPTETVSRENLKQAIVEALPHQAGTFEKYPDINSSLFLTEIQNALLQELKRTLKGEEESLEEIEKARKLLSAIG